jgi:prefoldin subunit 5
MGIQKTLTFGNRLIVGFVFFYAQALWAKFDIADPTDKHLSAIAIDRQQLPPNFDVDEHAAMCEIVNNAHGKAVYGNALYVAAPSGKGIFSSGLRRKRRSTYREIPVIDAYDILGLDWDLPADEQAAIDRNQAEIDQLQPEFDQKQAEIKQLQAEMKQIQAEIDSLLNNPPASTDKPTAAPPVDTPKQQCQRQNLPALKQLSERAKLLKQRIKDLKECLKSLQGDLQRLQKQKSVLYSSPKKADEARQKIKDYANCIKHYCNGPDQTNIDLLIEKLDQLTASSQPDTIAATTATAQDNCMATLGHIKITFHGIPSYRTIGSIHSVKDLFHTEMLLLYAMENAITVTVAGTTINFAEIANQRIINVCSFDDMCFRCEHMFAQFMQQRPEQEMFVSSICVYAHPSRIAAHQFGKSIRVGNIYKVAFVDPDDTQDTKSAPSSSATSAQTSTSPSIVSFSTDDLDCLLSTSLSDTSCFEDDLSSLHSILSSDISCFEVEPSSLPRPSSSDSSIIFRGRPKPPGPGAFSSDPMLFRSCRGRCPSFSLSDISFFEVEPSSLPRPSSSNTSIIFRGRPKPAAPASPRVPRFFSGSIEVASQAHP